MKKTVLAFAAASLALGMSAGAAASDERAAKGEAQLAKLIDGRTAGRPMSCIPAQVSRHLHVIDHTAVVYDAGNTVYVAKPSDPGSLDSNDILVINRFGSELCKQDVVRTIDRSSGFMTGVVFLGDFVPYTRNR